MTFEFQMNLNVTFDPAVVAEVQFRVYAAMSDEWGFHTLTP